jgi:thiol-disulfide isomerase/thioredoxin
MAEESIDVLTEGSEAPDFELEGTDGRTYTLSDFDDHEAVLLVFTTNHCPYAQAKIPVLNELAADYDDVAVVGINPNDDTEYPDDSYERMVELVEDGTVAYDAYLWDPTQESPKAYGAVCTPDPFLFENDDDRFRLVYHGRFDDALNPDDEPSGRPGEEIRSAIESVLAGRKGQGDGAANYHG